MSTNQALVLLFVLLPFVVAAMVFPFVAWRSRGAPKPVLTSEILANGTPARAQILSVRVLGSIVDLRPMVRFALRVNAGGPEPFDLEVVQSFPRLAARDFRPGDTVDVRLTADRSAGAVEWEGARGD